ncbi:MAG TPA: hypothetical protein VLB50_04235 [Ignavibacteriaceae bacterium]|nr:hypothetical protein [Ignavibacteriaceae bacterium]
MFVKRNGITAYIIIILILTLPAIAVNCKLVENPPGVTAVQNVAVKINSDSTGSASTAIISWDPSADQNDNDFSGYSVITYQLDANGNINSTFDKANLSKSTLSYTVDSIGTGVRFRTYIFSKLSDGTKSDSVGTIIYAGVFYRTDGIIDEYQPGDQTQIICGFGWDEQTGTGYNIPYLNENANFIDMNMRQNSSGILVFSSPALFSPGIRTTLFSLVGQGQAAFDQTDLTEPVNYSADVDSNNVYLVKLQEGIYVKVWVRDVRFITNSVPPFYNVIFDYKLQPIVGLRVL